jgi:mannose-6-phosphate isomerase-like protein (cupin superfamily)
LVVGDKEYSLGPGDSFHFPARYPHNYSTERGAKVLIVSTHKSFEAQASLRMEN